MNTLMTAATDVPELHELARTFEAARSWGRDYPHSPMLDEAFTLAGEDWAALRTFKAAWLAAKVATDADAAKLTAVRACAHALLGDLAPEIEHEGSYSGRSDASSYNPGSHVITLRGRLSIITFLHELTHSCGFGEVGAVWWSVNAFRLVWPKAFAKLENVAGTHVMRKVA